MFDILPRADGLYWRRWTKERVLSINWAIEETPSKPWPYRVWDPESCAVAGVAGSRVCADQILFNLRAYGSC
jgi:hypothetical protein